MGTTRTTCRRDSNTPFPSSSYNKIAPLSPCSLFCVCVMPIYVSYYHVILLISTFGVTAKNNVDHRGLGLLWLLLKHHTYIASPTPVKCILLHDSIMSEKRKHPASLSLPFQRVGPSYVSITALVIFCDCSSCFLLQSNYSYSPSSSTPPRPIVTLPP